MAAGALLPHIAPMFGVWQGQPPTDEGVRGMIEDLAEIATSTIGTNTAWVQDSSSRMVDLEALMRLTMKQGDDYAAVRDEMSHNPAMLGVVAGLARYLANSDRTEAYANGVSIFNKFGLSINPNK